MIINVVAHVALFFIWCEGTRVTNGSNLRLIGGLSQILSHRVGVAVRGEIARFPHWLPALLVPDIAQEKKAPDIKQSK